MQEGPELRWAFIRKVYSILAIQLLATIGFATVVVAVHPIANFFNNTRIGLATYVVITVIPLIGKAVIETLIATTVVVICLTAYTFWAARKGQDFGFLAPFLLSIIVILLIFTIFQIFFPMGKISEMIYGGFCAIIFCAYIIYDTDTLIKRNSYDEYIWASVSLYLDVLNLFVRLLEIFQAVNR
ncbi:hypothetical protein DH2020_024784 [Rehmannia glutinosa]|uniref:BI1-like protein n=1 Tax=Rehmannia glutinosa TaxID=99300 RepID=A0ABR0W1G6_REHGL